MTLRLIVLFAVLLALTTPGILVRNAQAGEFTPESLGMPRTSIVFSDRMLRLFNGRGAISIRDKSVTGLQELQFPPIDIRDYRFQLAFREKTTQVLIQDVVADVYEHMVLTGQGPHPLGLNFQSPGAPWVMILQQAYWQPNLMFRSGTFHKVFDGHWISFGIETKTSVSAARDEIYLEVELENRQPTPLMLTVIPEQSAPELALKVPNEKAEQQTAPGSAPSVPDGRSQPEGPVTHPDVFTLASRQIKIRVVSDLPAHSKAGWNWEIPGATKQAARFAIVLQQARESSPEVYAADIAQKIGQSDQALRDRFRWAGERLPRISTADVRLNTFYDRCLLSVLDSRWERENFITKPFYTCGTWLFSLAWDTSYASQLLALLDPEGLREAFLTYIRVGLLKSSYVPWNGKTNEYWYAQNPFAEMRILQDYLRQTGDLTFLDHIEEGATVFEWMKRMGRELVKRYARPDGLLDFGAGSEKTIEMRTDGYQHVVAAMNGMSFAYFRQLAFWARQRQEPEAPQFDQWANQLHKSMNEKLWNEQAGWFDNLYPDGSRHLVWSYHLFDVLDGGLLSEAQQRRLTSHIVEGEFLGPYGMYSVSKIDRIHWDLEDVDWGGGGQYAGAPLRIAEFLYRLGYGELGWNVLSRCTYWVDRFPYIPQEIFADFLGNPAVEMPLEISAGSGVQAILFGIFGLRPVTEGTLEICPSYHQELGEASMMGYRFRGHTYDVVMGPWGFKVFKDGKVAARNPHGVPVKFPKP